MPGNGRDIRDEVGALVTQIERLVKELRRLIDEDDASGGGQP